MSNDNNGSSSNANTKSGSSNSHSTEQDVSIIDLTQAQAQLGVQVQRREVERFKASDLVPERSGVLKTAHMPNGEPAYQLTPNALIMIRRVPVPLHRAEAWGYVKRDSQGNYVDATVEKQVAEAQKAADLQAGKDEQQWGPSGEEKDYLGDLAQALTGMGVSPKEFVLRYMRDPKATVTHYGDSLKRGLGYESVEDLTHDLQTTAGKVLAKVWGYGQAQGLDLAEWDRYVTAKPIELGAAVLQLLEGDSSVLHRLVESFKRDKPNYKRALPAGVKTGKTRDGVEFVRVRLPNGKVIEVSVANARLQGWLK